MARLAIETRNLTKTFAGGTVAVSGLDLTIPPGVVYGLIGRNGAGKTTTMRLLMGLLRPDQGMAEILGTAMWNADRSSRSRVGYVSQSQQLPGWMTLQELCRYARHFYPRWDHGFARDLIRRWTLCEDRPLALLSGGEQRKAAILLALAPRPEVLLLDEPAAGLDPVSRRELIDELIRLLSERAEATVVFSTHIISDLERIAERIGILDRGRLILNEPLDELQATFRRVQVIFPGEAPPPHFAIPGTERCHVSGAVVTGVAQLGDGDTLESVRRWPGVRVQVFPLALEEIFIEAAGRSARPAAETILAEEFSAEETLELKRNLP